MSKIDVNDIFQIFGLVSLGIGLYLLYGSGIMLSVEGAIFFAIGMLGRFKR